MRLQKSKFHFVGVGGIGMCGLAELLHNIGAQVSGSDLSENANTERLKDLGVRIHKGHKAENVGDADVVVYSSAVHFGNPEIAEARARQIPLIPRAEALAEIMRLKRGVAVAGTHGKTTTTSMTASIFLHAQMSPTIVIGGRFEQIKSTALLGQGEWLIAEADESDGSFQKLSPEISIITNIDSDHMDHYKNFENLKRSFYEFALKAPFYGLNIICGDDADVREMFEGFHKRILFYGFNEKNDYLVKGERGHYQLFYKDRIKGSQELLGSFQVNVPGIHNALNATAAIIAGLSAGIPFSVCAEGLSKFIGVDRRFHFKGEKSGIRVYDDYGHHPTEVRATLQAFREKYPDRRLVVYFQPHRYSRTEHCWSDFLSSFGQCDFLFLGDIYAAGENAIPGISSERLAKEIKNQNVSYLSKDSSLEMAKKMRSELKPGDVFVTLGAGDGWKLGVEILSQL